MVFLDKELANLSVLVKRLNIYFIRIIAMLNSYSGSLDLIQLKINNFSITLSVIVSHFRICMSMKETVQK